MAGVYTCLKNRPHIPQKRPLTQECLIIRVLSQFLWYKVMNIYSSGNIARGHQKNGPRPKKPSDSSNAESCQAQGKTLMLILIRNANAKQF